MSASSEIDSINVDGFQIVSVLGQGGFATVYKAQHLFDDTPVALKVLKSGSDSEQDLFGDFFNEVQAAATLNHPRIATVHDFGECILSKDTKPSFWLTMEVVEGGTLKDLKGKLSWTELKSILFDILDGLSHAHARRLVHRDIKPQNILYDQRTKRIKITDFGLVRSCSFDSDNIVFHESVVQGTPSYMAPEQILNEPLLMGPWTDLYALGCLVWEMVCGKPPYQGANEDIFRQHLRGVLPLLEPQFQIPDQLRSWLSRLIARGPNDRFQNARQARYALGQLEYGTKWISTPMVSMGSEFDKDMPTVELSSIFHLDDTIAITTELANDHFQYQSSNVAGFQSGRHRFEYPISWQSNAPTKPQLLGVGLNLLELRTLELIGRTTERDQLWDIFQSVYDTQDPRTVFIEGVTGIGKRSLAMWMAHRTRELGIGNWIYIGFSTEQDYRLELLDIIGSYLGIHNSSSQQSKDRLQQIHRQLNMSFPEDVTDLLWLMEHRFDLERTAELWKEKVFNALITRFIVGLSRVEPLILILDGVHHSIEVTGIIDQIHEQKCSILTLATLNSVRETNSDVTQTLDRFVQAKYVHLLTLLPLKSVEQVQFVQSLLGVSLDVATIIEQKSHGHPKVAVQLVLGWIEQGGLIPTAQGFVLNDEKLITLPDSILDVWTRRYQNLKESWTSEELYTLHFGAILGNVVQRSDVLKCLDTVSQEYSEDLMHVLRKNGWVSLLSVTEEWHFTDSMFRESILSQLTITQQREFLTSIVLDSLPVNSISVQRRAKLLTHSGRPEQALTPLYQSAVAAALGWEIGKAQRDHRLRNSILEMAQIDAGGPHALESEILHLLLAPSKDQISILEAKGESLLQWAKDLERWDDVIQLYNYFGFLYWNHGNVMLAEQSLLIGRELAQIHKHRVEIFILHKLIFLSKDSEINMGYGRSALYLSEQFGDVRLIGTSYKTLGIVCYRSEKFDEAAFFLREAQLRFERCDNRSGLIDLYSRQGELYRLMKNFEESEQAYLHSLKLIKMLSTTSINTVMAQVNLMIVYFEMNDLDKLVSIASDIWKFVYPELHSNLPKIAQLIGELSQALSLSVQEKWTELYSLLHKLSNTMDVIHFFDNDVYWFLNQILELSMSHDREDCTLLIKRLIHDQYCREGQLDMAKQYV